MEKIINQVKTGWSKDLIIRFLYVKLAPYFERDLLYFLASDEEKEKEFNKGFVNRFPKIVCATLADFYVSLFKQFGINAHKIIANSAKIPLFAIIVEGDSGWYFLDPINDLFYNQYGLKATSFGMIPHYRTIHNNYPYLIKLSKEYINELDTTLHFSYLNPYFDKIHQQLTQRTRANKFFGLSPTLNSDLKFKKLKLCNDKLINLGHVNGLFERALLYRYLQNKIFNHSEKRHIYIRIKDKSFITVEVENNDEHVLYKEEKQNDQYVLSKKLVWHDSNDEF